MAEIRDHRTSIFHRFMVDDTISILVVGDIADVDRTSPVKAIRVSDDWDLPPIERDDARPCGNMHDARGLFPLMFPSEFDPMDPRKMRISVPVSRMSCLHRLLQLERTRDIRGVKLSSAGKIASVPMKMRVSTLSNRRPCETLRCQEFLLHVFKSIYDAKYFKTKRQLVDKDDEILKLFRRTSRSIYHDETRLKKRPWKILLSRDGRGRRCNMFTMCMPRKCDRTRSTDAVFFPLSSHEPAAGEEIIFLRFDD